MHKHKQSRGFSSKFGFLMATVGSAVGLGNLWSFPYRVGKGGGAVFVLVYICMVALVGLVAMIGEFVVGKRSQVNVIDTFSNISKKSKWLGYLGIIVPFIILCYYQVIGGWSVKYMIDYVGGIGVGNIANNNISNIGDMFGSFIGSVGMPVVYLLIFAGFVAAIVLGGVNKGIEKASKILMPMLFVCLLIVIVKSLTLPNAVKGLEFLFKPDFAQMEADGITIGAVILSALGQVFFSMSLGMGINIAYGSYMRDNMNVGFNSLIVAIMDTFMALLAGLAIFPAVFSFGLKPQSGPGLLFIALAEVFASMGPVAGRIFGGIFFLLVTLAAVTSSIALLEVPVQFFVEKFHINRKLASICVAGCAFGIGTFVAMSFGVPAFQVGGVNLLDFLDYVSNKLILPVTAAATCLLIGYKIKPKNLMEDLQADTKGKITIYKIWGFLIRYVTPVGILCVLGIGINETFSKESDFATLGGQLTVLFTAIAIIGVSVVANAVANSMERKKLKQFDLTKENFN